MSRLIDADALKRQYEEHKRWFCRNRIEFSTLSDKDKARVDELDNCISDILNAPAIEERKTGKWIKDNGDWFKTMFKCSECGAFIRKQDRFISFFCYHCGADMREDVIATEIEEYKWRHGCGTNTIN